MTSTGKAAMILVVWVYVIGMANVIWAETRYVSDRLVVQLRDQKGNQYSAIKTLTSDTPVEILLEEDGFCKVRTEQKEEGWIPSRYLLAETPKSMVIEKLTERIKQLSSGSGSAKVVDCEKQCAELHSSNKQLLDRIGMLEQDISFRTDEIRLLKEENVKSSDAPGDTAEINPESANLLAENQSLRETNDRLGKEIATLKEISQKRQKNEITKLFADGKGWFVIGAIVFFLGLIFGHFTNSSGRRKYY